jgi:hypothetical protein
VVVSSTRVNLSLSIASKSAVPKENSCGFRSLIGGNADPRLCRCGSFLRLRLMELCRKEPPGSVSWLCFFVDFDARRTFFSLLCRKPSLFYPRHV